MHGGENAGRAPGGIDLDGQRPRFGPALRRREVLELLDQNVGAAAAGCEQRFAIGARTKEPGAAQRWRPAPGDALA